MEEQLKIISHLVVFFTFSLMIYAIIHDLMMGLYWRAIIWLSVLPISLFFYLRVRNISNMASISVNIMIILSIFGEMILGLYYTTTYYDKFLHFIIPLMMVFVANDFLNYRIKYSKKRAIISLIISITLTILWEVAEGIMYFGFGAPVVGVAMLNSTNIMDKNIVYIMSPIQDTLYDILFDLIGTILAFILLVKRNKD